MIFRYNGQETIDDTGIVSGDLPSWYKDSEGALFDQYLWVDEGTKLDYDRRSQSVWRTEGYDTGKHYFFAEDGSNWKIKDKGNDDPWSFKDQCQAITDYQLEGETGQCLHGAENLADTCFHLALLDFSKSDAKPKLIGMGDLESAGN